MGIEIATINNIQLRHAAEIADSQGKHAKNGLLDKNEINIFKEEAKNLGCSNNEIDIICKQVESASRAEKKNERKKSFLAYGASQAAMLFAGITAGIFSTANKLISKRLNPEKVTIVNNAADEVLSSLTNLGAKGVKIHDVKDYTKNMEKSFSNKIFNLLGGNAVAQGKNAQYIPGLKEVMINREKMALSTFHELGHAYNHLNSTFWNKVQKLRMPMMGLATSLAILPAFMEEEKPKSGEELTFGQKLKNRFRKACPILASAAMLPIVAEEAMASARGNQWAKALLNPELSRKVAASSAFGLASYISLAAGIGLCSYFALKVKDKK